jgi:hypothetical protein
MGSVPTRKNPTFRVSSESLSRATKYSNSRMSNGGADGSRTHDLLNAIQALSQLSYGPTRRKAETVFTIVVHLRKVK